MMMDVLIFSKLSLLRKTLNVCYLMFRCQSELAAANNSSKTLLVNVYVVKSDYNKSTGKIEHGLRHKNFHRNFSKIWFIYITCVNGSSWIFLLSKYTKSSFEETFFISSITCCSSYSARNQRFFILTQFMPLVSFYTPWKHEKTKGNLIISGGGEKRTLT